MHSHTYTGHALSCAAALAAQQEVRERRLLENVNAKGELLRASCRRASCNAVSRTGSCATRWAA